jgi:hypothetical protein
MLSELKDEILWGIIILLLIALLGTHLQLLSCRDLVLSYKDRLKTNKELTDIVVQHNTAMQNKYNIYK